MKDKTGEGGLYNGLKAIRTRLGLSQKELAQAAGITRQTIGGIEASLYSPSAAVALRIARALGCPVEEIFWLEGEASEKLEVEQAQSASAQEVPDVAGRVLLGRVGEKWVAHSLTGESAFRSEMVPADGLVVGKAKNSGMTAQLLDSVESLSRTVLIGGCAPALSLWTRSAERWHPGLRAAWIHLNSTEALQALARDEIHIAGMHLHDAESGEDNSPFIGKVFGNEASEIALINFGCWDEGLLVARGNPKGIKSVEDLTGVKIVNREPGAGARILLDSLLKQAKISSRKIDGYDVAAGGHQEVARTIIAGTADAGMSTSAVAQMYGLDFIPLRHVRYDLALRKANLEFEPIKQLLGTLEHRSVRAQLQVLGGYDTARTGEAL